MTDIVERLRGEVSFQEADAKAWGVDTYGDLPRYLKVASEAADEIARLRAEVERLKADEESAALIGANYQDAMERAEAERDAALAREAALRKSLEDIRRRWEARSELFRDDGECASALADCAAITLAAHPAPEPKAVTVVDDDGTEWTSVEIPLPGCGAIHWRVEEAPEPAGEGETDNDA